MSPGTTRADHRGRRFAGMGAIPHAGGESLRPDRVSTGMELELRFFATFRAAVGQKTIYREYPDGSPGWAR